MPSVKQLCQSIHTCLFGTPSGGTPSGVRPRGTIEADDWHMNVRPSNTEPLLRLNLEARSQELMERKRDEVLAVIRG